MYIVNTPVYVKLLDDNLLSGSCNIIKQEQTHLLSILSILRCGVYDLRYSFVFWELSILFAGYAKVSGSGHDIGDLKGGNLTKEYSESQSTYIVANVFG